jgi:hypothetical protein
MLAINLLAVMLLRSKIIFPPRMKALLTLILTVAIGTVTTQAQTLPPVKELMSAAEFRNVGFHRLTSAEMDKLNAWLLEYTLGVVELISNTEVGGTAAVIESQVDGNFEGWEGETIFKLLNGQIWQQSSYAYRYHYAFMPKVTIFKSSGGYKMIVDGVSGSIYVVQLK